MAAVEAIVSCESGQENRTWLPTTLDRLNKNELFLEKILAASPELMGLESRRSGIRGPFCAYRQLDMATPSGRPICPDIVLLAASGNVIVVEVKRYVNPELRDRAVIAQIIDYASSFAALSEEQVKSLFEKETISPETWPGLVESLFPEESKPEELADVLLGRMQSGELNLVIACDKVPVGLPDVVAGIASQKTVGFDLDLVEITPYVQEVTETAEIIFVPSTRLQTEIVSRTAVTVTYRSGDQRPSTNVQTTSAQDVIRIGTGRRETEPRPRPERLEFWQEFSSFLQEYTLDVKPSRATDGASLDVTMEATGIALKAYMYNDPPDCMGVRFKDRNNVIDSLPDAVIQEIQQAIGSEFSRGKKKKKSTGKGPSVVCLEREVDLSDHNTWPAQHKWLLDAIRTIDTALAPYPSAVGENRIFIRTKAHG